MCDQYWLEEGTEKFGQFEVSLKAKVEYSEHIIREFEVVDTKVSQSLLAGEKTITAI